MSTLADGAAGGGFVFDSYGGAINQVAADATAFVHRGELAGVQYSVTWTATASPSVVTAASSWLRLATRAVAPYTHGAYQNYLDPTLADWQQAYYGANLTRLVEVKRSVDPDDVFHFAQSIPV
ncbi:MAG: BBE domain-containing protein [Acidimicrobiales bacterium]